MSPRGESLKAAFDVNLHYWDLAESSHLIGNSNFVHIINQCFRDNFFSPITKFFKNNLQLFHQIPSMLDKNMQLFSHDDFTIFTDPPHPQFNDETPRPRSNNGTPSGCATSLNRRCGVSNVSETKLHTFADD